MHKLCLQEENPNVPSSSFAITYKWFGYDSGWLQVRVSIKDVNWMQADPDLRPFNTGYI